MHFEERTEGTYRIYAGARETQAAQGRGGYVAAVVVHRLRGNGERRSEVEAFRDDAIAFGYVWPSHAKALRYAFATAKAAIRAIG